MTRHEQKENPHRSRAEARHRRRWTLATLLRERERQERAGLRSDSASPERAELAKFAEGNICVSVCSAFPLGKVLNNATRAPRATRPAPANSVGVVGGLAWSPS